MKKFLGFLFGVFAFGQITFAQTLSCTVTNVPTALTPVTASGLIGATAATTINAPHAFSGVTFSIKKDSMNVIGNVSSLNTVVSHSVDIDGENFNLPLVNGIFTGKMASGQTFTATLISGVIDAGTVSMAGDLTAANISKPTFSCLLSTPPVNPQKTCLSHTVTTKVSSWVYDANKTPACQPVCQTGYTLNTAKTDCDANTNPPVIPPNSGKVISGPAFDTKTGKRIGAVVGAGVGAGAGVAVTDFVYNKLYDATKCYKTWRTNDHDPDLSELDEFDKPLVEWGKSASLPTLVKGWTPKLDSLPVYDREMPGDPKWEDK